MIYFQTKIMHYFVISSSYLEDSLKGQLYYLEFTRQVIDYSNIRKKTLN